MIWALIIVALIGASIVALWLRGRRQSGTGKPISLASQVLRRPERVLIDVPLAFSNYNAVEGCKLLLEAEAELGQMGGLHMRRQLLMRFAGVLKTPSKESAKELTDFLFDAADQEFQKTLRWDGRCQTAMGFLRLLHAMIESVENGRPVENIEDLIANPSKKGKAKRRKKSDETALNTLKGKDRDVGYEWRRLFLALSEVVAPAPPGKSKASKKLHSKRVGCSGDETSASAPRLPTSLVDPSRANYLAAFQKVANEVGAQYLSLTGAQRLEPTRHETIF